MTYERCSNSKDQGTAFPYPPAQVAQSSVGAPQLSNIIVVKNSSSDASCSDISLGSISVKGVDSPSGEYPVEPDKPSNGVPKSKLGKFLTESQLNDEVPEKLSYAAVTQGRTETHSIVAFSSESNTGMGQSSLSSCPPIQVVSNPVIPIYARMFHGASFPWVHHNPVMYSTISQTFIPMYHILPSTMINPQSAVHSVLQQPTPHPEKQYLPLSQKPLKGCEEPSKLKSPDAPSQSQRSAPSSRISTQHLECYPPPPFSPNSQFKSPPPTVPIHLGLNGSKSVCSCSSQKDVEKDTGNRQVCCRLYVYCD